MSLVPFGRLGPNATLAQVAAQTDRITQVLNQEVEFGEPQDPNSLTSLKLAGTGMTAAGAHNGTPGNIAGSYHEQILFGTAPLTATNTFRHNLYLDNPNYVLPDSSSPNVRWHIHGINHDGTNADSTSVFRVFLMYIGGTITANSIELRTHFDIVGTTPSVGGNDPINLTVFFTKATKVIY